MSTARVLMVSNHADVVGGGEISLLTLVRGLSKTRWQPLVTVPAPGEVADRCRALGVAVHETPLPTLRRPGPGILGAARTMRRLVADSGASLVHANGSRAMFYAGLGTRLRPLPVVWHLRIAPPDPQLDRILVRMATVPVAVSRAVRERLRAWPAAYDACRVIPNGLDLDAFVATRDRAEVRRELGLAPDEAAIVCVSRLVEGKRQALLLDAYATLRRRMPTARCIIVGDGPEEERLRRRAEAADLSGSVIFTGRRGDVADLLGAADLFVLPAEKEGFGRVVIEAMACGLPVVVADSGGPAEIVVDGVSGLRFATGSAGSLADRLESLCADPELRRRLGVAARRRARSEFSMQAHTRRIVELYEWLRTESGAAVATAPPHDGGDGA